MITLITGTPGAGKTAWTVQELTRLPSQRKIYIHGIPELKIAHEAIYCTSQLCDYCREVTHLVDYPDSTNEAGEVIPGYQVLEPINQPGQEAYLVEDWPEWATEGSLLVVDEVQRIWRPLNSSTGLPPEVAALETHRHKGLDFWLISQGPHLFHANIRLLIGKHIHLVSKWNGRSEYEWPECRQSVTSRGDAVTRPYKLPSKIFHLYKSSSLHVKQSHRKPLAFYGLFFCAALLLVMGYVTYTRVTAHMKKPDTTANAEQTPQTAPAGGGGGAAAANTTDKIQAKNAASGEFPDYKPVLEGVPESAPAYAPLIKVLAAPIMQGCVYSKAKDDCRCFTAQATLYPTSKAYCLETIANHRFNPYSKSVSQTSTVIHSDDSRS